MRPWRTCLPIILLIPVVLGLGATSAHAGQILLDFADIPPGTLTVFNPYVSQGFVLTSTSGGFVVNSPDSGNGAPQTVGNNPFYAGSTGLAAFAPATITLSQVSGDPFSILSIDLARNFAFDPAPTVSFTATLADGGTISQTFTVSSASPPLAFETFQFTGFDAITSLSWDQGSSTGGIHQFGNIRLASPPVPEPASLILLAVGIPLAWSASRARPRRD